jgi:hypothetical protein
MGVRVYEDWYKVKLNKAGMMRVNLSAPYVDKYFAADPWCLELRNSANRKLWFGFRPNMNGSRTMFVMGLPAGTYYLNLYSSSVPNVTYSLTVGFNEGGNWELEPANDFMSSANALALGKTKCGSVYGCLDMGSNTDLDWYRLNVPSAGKYNVRFGAEANTEVPSPWYLLDLYDGRGNWLWNTSCDGDGWARTVATLNLNAGTYYLKVQGARYLDAQHYELTVSRNNTKATNPLSAKGKTLTMKRSTLKKKKLTFARSKAFTVTGARDTVTFAKASGNAKLVVSKAGTVTVKKGLKKGTYYLKVKVTAAGNSSYKAASKTVTVTVRVK